MTPSTPTTPQVFRIDGNKVDSVAGFYREVGEAVNGPGGYFGGNLDALADCLRGGFGTPTDRPFLFDWDHSAPARRVLEAERRGFVAAVREVFDAAGIPLRLR